jgi:hypothetical protein
MTFQKIDDLAKQSLTPKGYKLFSFVNSKLPDIWNRSSSSSMKYHKKADGSIPTIAEHSFEMFQAAVKTIQMWGNETISKRNDAFLMAIILHDSLKYGPTGKNPHTTRNHDQQLANFFLSKKEIFLKHFNEEEFALFLSCIRFHSGRWSPDAKGIPDVLYNLPPEVIIVHFLDMVSTKDCLISH